MTEWKDFKENLSEDQQLLADVYQFLNDYYTSRWIIGGEWAVRYTALHALIAERLKIQ